MKITDVLSEPRLITIAHEFGEFLVKLSVAVAGIALLTPFFREGNLSVGGLVSTILVVAIGIYLKTIKK
jgi:hypothetical protein